MATNPAEGSRSRRGPVVPVRAQPRLRYATGESDTRIVLLCVATH